MSLGPVLAPDGLSARLDAPLAWTLLIGGAALLCLVLVLLARAVALPAQAVRPGR